MFAGLMCIHYIADFLLQPREMGKRKSSEPKWLAGHLLIQFLCFLPFTGWKFALANCVVHGIIDWNIWKGYKWSAYYRIKKDTDGMGWTPEIIQEHIEAKGKQWEYWEDHLFYATIGLDQLLHCLTIYYLAGLFL